MLKIVVPAGELWDSKTEEFIITKQQVLQLEHSLISISKWESKWHQAFLNKQRKKTSEMVVDYVRCMTLNQNVDPNVYMALTEKNYKDITDYIENPMSATCFPDDNGRNVGGTREVVTSELIYYWMVAFNIPFECEKWHLNRLLNLVHICSIKNSPPKKMGRNEILQRNHALNAARKAKLHTRG